METMVSKTSVLLLISYFLLVLPSYPQSIRDTLRKCICNDTILHFPNDPSFEPILEYTISNLRLVNHSNPKPLAIITPLNYSHVQTSVVCAKKIGVQVRVRSGGHDYEGMSYTSTYCVPFLLVDLVNLTSVIVDVETEKKTAWVQGGATNGQLYYWIDSKTQDYGFPGGICPSVGLTGLITGGGVGYLTRKYGLAADNVIDALIVDVKGQLLNREKMGEDIFWAIRGGGAASFGVIVAWKLQLVPIPRIVTCFNASRSLEQGAITLIEKSQLACSIINENLRMRIEISTKNQDTKVTFSSVFLGKADELLNTLEKSIPELKLTKGEYKEMSWIESVMYFYYPPGEPKEALRDRKPIPSFKSHFKYKSDFVVTPLTNDVIKQLWRKSLENENFHLVMFSHGGKVNRIHENETPFPFRKGILYDIEYMMEWKEDDLETAKKHIFWVRRVYKYMAKYVLQNPRGAYSNFRDFDLGINDIYGGTYEEAARTWGVKYFNNNLQRLAIVKGKVDPENFFALEQTVPPLILLPEIGREKVTSATAAT
ncbi:hypothetical protein M9H77_03058 [Catharanthus roseus]|uniref:Uncharacterized protein n=1 Tax=Catharanthus roseus TaxID=4058 RepID=A0ACC0CA64_CATRO|nr:hypothetical protein M9H77_03058 [Catharanthus roseus]